MNSKFATIRKYKKEVVRAAAHFYIDYLNMWIVVGVITSALTLVACGKSEHKDNAETMGAQQNTCMTDALVATKYKYNMSYDQLIGRDKINRHAFIGTVEFKSLKTEKWALENIYPDNTLKDGSKIARPGIMAAARVPMRTIKEIYPDVILTEVSNQPTSLVVMVTCRPDLTAAPRSRSEPSTTYTTLNRELGVYESKKNGEVISIPIDDGDRYPDGTVVALNCEENLTKICSSTFVLVPGVFVEYRYPVEQRADWKRIKNFVVSSLNASMIVK